MGGPRRFAIDQTTITRLAAAGAVLVAIGAGLWLWSPGPVPTGFVSPAATEQAPFVTMTVHVTGAVVDPGLVELAVGSRVADAVAAAGGTLPEADLGALNLAAPVRDGEQVHIGLGGPGGGAATPADDGRIRINLATVDDLEKLPGVGPVLAQRIMDHREQHGPFASVEDLLDVPGIGEAKLAAMRDAVAVP